MDTLFLDIETIPTEREDVIADLRSGIKPPAQYKKPESIAEWMRDNLEAETDQAVRKTALDGAFGRVCVAGFAIDEGEVDSVSDDTDEGVVLRGLNNFLDASISPNHFRSVIVVTHYGTGFDLRFLWQRCIVHGIKPHPIIRQAAMAKPWDACVYDTMVQWAGQKGSISLDKLCRALGVESPKGEMDGSMVYDYVRAGRIADVAAYCRRDVEALREVYYRMTFQTGPAPISFTTPVTTEFHSVADVDF